MKKGMQPHPFLACFIYVRNFDGMIFAWIYNIKIHFFEVYMVLNELFNIKSKDIISIVGAGGKTSLMFYLAEELRQGNKVLVTTTTKIFMPDKEQYDFFAIEEGNKFHIYDNNSYGIYVLGGKVNEENKVEGISRNFLKSIVSCFDYIFIESDGSKMKPIKGWNEWEPVIYEETTKTIGVLDIQVTGKRAKNNLVHRLDKFIELTSIEENEIITIAHLEKLITNKEGLFKNGTGEKILYINKVESEEDLINAEKLSKSLFLNRRSQVDKVIIGSIKNNRFRKYP